MTWVSMAMRTLRQPSEPAGRLLPHYLLGPSPGYNGRAGTASDVGSAALAVAQPRPYAAPHCAQPSIGCV